MMTQRREDLQGRGEVEARSWARIQPMGDGVQLALRIARQIGALRQILAHQAIRVFIGPAWPGAVRIGKEDLDGESLSQTFVLGHLFALIVGQRLAQWGWHVPEFFRKARSGTPRIDRKSTRLNSSHPRLSRMPSSA